MLLPINEDWDLLKRIFPSNWESLSKETGSIKRYPKGFSGVEGLLRAILLHAGKGYSLKETSTRIRESGIGTASAPALQKALAKSELWLHKLCELLYMDNANINLPLNSSDIKMRLIDGSVVKEPGKTGSQWLMHYSISLPSLSCDYFRVTAKKGSGNGESLKKYPLNRNDCLIADRGYSRADDIFYVNDNDAYVITRLNTSSLPLYDIDSENKINLLAKVKSISKPLSSQEWQARILSGDKSRSINIRVCAIRKSDYAINLALEKLRKDAIKRQSKLSEDTKEFAKYIIVCTSLPREKYKTEQILNWYRVRWQIELVFKRLKSIAGLGHLPKYNDSSSKAWLYAKLFIGLLSDKLARYSETFSPWGYRI